MIVVLDARLFSPEHSDDALLGSILWHGMHGRFGVKTRPAFRRDADHPANRWIDDQSTKAAETALEAFKRGLKWKAYAREHGRREPEVILEPRQEGPEWPRSFDQDPVRLPLGLDARRLLERPLRVLLESGQTDWAFLEKIVPTTWRKRWRRAVDQGWLESQHGGGIAEIRKILVNEVSRDEIRRLRLWVMFDSDARKAGDPSEESQRTRQACEGLHVPFHQLERRTIENYIPPRALRQWAADVDMKVRAGSNKEKDVNAVAVLVKAVNEYCELPANQRHYVSLKSEKFIPPRRFGYSTPADVWTNDTYALSESEFIADGWDDERQALFRSLMMSL